MYKTTMMKKLVLGFCLLFACFFAHPGTLLYSQSSSLENNVMDHYLNGNKLYKEGKFKEAQDEYQKAFELLDNSSEETMLTPGRKPQLPVNWETDETKKFKDSDPLKQAYDEARDARKKLQAITIGNTELDIKDKELETLAESLTLKFQQQSSELTQLRESQDKAREAKNKLNDAIALNVGLTQKQRDLEDNIDELNEKIIQQNRNIETQKFSHDEELSAKKDLNMLVASNLLLQQKITEAEAEINTLNQKLKQQEDLINMIAQTKEETRSAKNQHDEILSQNGQLQQSLSEMNFNIGNLKQKIKSSSHMLKGAKIKSVEPKAKRDSLSQESSIDFLQLSTQEQKQKDIGNTVDKLNQKSEKQTKTRDVLKETTKETKQIPAAIETETQKPQPPVINNPVKVLTPEPEKISASPVKPGSLEYILGEGDELKISVWQNADLDQETIIRPDGKISFSLIGDIPATGLSVSQLDNLITEKLKEFIKQPEVTIIIKKMGGQKVIVLGEVVRPGVYAVSGARTVLEAIGQAGSFSKDAVPSSVIFIRKSGDKPQARRINLSRTLSNGDLSQNLEIQSEDIIFVPKKFIADVNYFLETVLGPFSKGIYTYREIQGL